MLPQPGDSPSVPTPAAAARRQDPRGDTQRMDATDLLSAGIAHDFNNLLTIINGYNEMLLASCELSEKARQCLAVVRSAGESAATLARALMALNRRAPLEPGSVDVNESVGELVTLAQHLLPANIELSAVLAPGLPMVLADRCAIPQVLLNLVVNARDAMPEGGKVEIRTAQMALDAVPSNLHPDLARGNYILLTVSDNGAGMDEETRLRIFEPFYTTKAPGAGTGLGLPMVQHIVNQNGGHLTIESAKGEGTTVRIYLPAAAGERPLEAVQAVESTGTPRGGCETILLVEDNLDLRNLMRTVLEDLGYSVLDAGSASEAAEVSNSLTGRLDLLVADLVLPDSSGNELADCLHELRPGLPVLLTSGYLEEDALEAGPDSVAEFLSKPFTLAEFGERVRCLLDRKKRPRILFVDDDPQVVMFATEVLQDAGFEVLVGNDGNEALSIVQVERVDLVITDLVMREREGLETMMGLRKSHPELPVIAISGAFGGHFLRSAALLGARATLAKPFSGEDLLSAVRTVLGS